MKAKLKDLQVAAQELNAIGIDPEIDAASTDVEVLFAGIKDSLSVIEDTDEFTTKTQSVIDEVTEIVEADKVPEEKPKRQVKPVAAPVVAKKEVVEEDAETTLYDKVKATAKVADLKAIVEEEDDFKKIRKAIDTFKNPFILKRAMLDILEESDPKLATGAAEKKAAKTAKKEVDPNAPKKKNPFVKVAGQLSNLEVAEKLLSEKADPKTIYATFTKVYEGKAGADEKYIKGRADIYMKIAAKGK